MYVNIIGGITTEITYTVDVSRACSRRDPSLGLESTQDQFMQSWSWS